MGRTSEPMCILRKLSQCEIILAWMPLAWFWEFANMCANVRAGMHSHVCIGERAGMYANVQAGARDGVPRHPAAETLANKPGT